MSNDISACNNYNCEMYRFNKCRRAIRHKEAINKREQWVSYIPNKGNTKPCDVYLEKESK